MQTQNQTMQTVADRVKMNPRVAAVQANEALMSNMDCKNSVQGKEVYQTVMRVCVNVENSSRRVVEVKKQVVEPSNHRYMLRSMRR